MRVLGPALVLAAIGIGAWRIWDIARRDEDDSRSNGRTGIARFAVDTYLQILAVAAGLLLLLLIIMVSRDIIANI